MTNAFIKAILNSRDLSMDELAGRDVVDEAANIPDGPKTVARDGTDSSTNAFIKALLNSRDSSKSLTTDEVLSLASLASRALDELD